MTSDNQAANFVIDDLAHYVQVFNDFGIDIREKVMHLGYTKDQFSVSNLDSYLEQELSEDAQHQTNWWIIKDRAYEAFGIIESDGHGIAVDGRLMTYAKHVSSRRNNRAFLNIVKGNRDRVVSQIESVDFSIEATPNYDKDRDIVERLNKRKTNILEDNNWDAVHSKYITDGVTYGSGVFSVNYGDWPDNPSIAKYINKIESGKALTLDEYTRFQQAMKGHQIRYVDTFEMIRCRHARGPESTTLRNKKHRWIHRIEQISMSEAMRDYPEYAVHIGNRISEHYANTNPAGYFNDSLADTITKKTTWVRFGIHEVKNVMVIDPTTNEEILFPTPVKRYAIGKFVRLEGIGVVSAEIDYYRHNMFPFVMWVYTPSRYHSCGIGLVKYGRDPQVIYNQLHNGMIEYIGRMAKGGGYFDSRLGISDTDINDMSKPGTWKKITVNPQLGERPLRDFMLENRPQAFPSVYSDLMSIERQAADDTMNVPNVWKGIRSGDSGKQEQILQNQADMAHSSTLSAIGECYQEFALQLYSNIQQFNQDPLQFSYTDPMTNTTESVELNSQPDAYLVFNEETGEYDVIEGQSENSVVDVMFDIRVDKNTLIPTRPTERGAFLMNFFQQSREAVMDPRQRVWLREMNRIALRIPELNNALDLIDQMDQAASEANAEAEESAKQNEQFKEDRDYMLKLMKTLADVQKVNQELAQRLDEQGTAMQQQPQ